MNKTELRAATSAAKRIIKGCAREQFRGIFEQHGDFCLTDGFRLLRFTGDFPELPHVDVDVRDFRAHKYIEDCMTMNLPLQLPTVAELRTYLSDHDAVKEPYCLDGRVLVNASYLRDMLSALPGCTAYIPATPYSPVYFSGKNGDGILLPVRTDSIPRMETLLSTAQERGDLQAANFWEDRIHDLRERERESSRERARIAAIEAAEREAQEARERQLKERATAERAARIAPLEGYLDTLSPAQAARAEKYLLDKKVRYNGAVINRCEYIKSLIADGLEPQCHDYVVHRKRNGELSTPKTEYWLIDTSASWGYKISKTEYCFALFLLEQRKAEEGTEVVSSASPEVTQVPSCGSEESTNSLQAIPSCEASDIVQGPCESQENVQTESGASKRKVIPAPTLSSQFRFGHIAKSSLRSGVNPTAALTFHPATFHCATGARPPYCAVSNRISAFYAINSSIIIRSRSSLS